MEVEFRAMDVQAFRSPIAKFAGFLWLGCLQWTAAIPLVLMLPFMCSKPKSSVVSYLLIVTFALGWTGRTIQSTLNPLVLSPKTSIWTCNTDAETKDRSPLLQCVNDSGHTYTVEALTALPLHSPFLGTIWPFKSNSYRRFKHNKGIHGTIRSTIRSDQNLETTPEYQIGMNTMWDFLSEHFTSPVPGLLQALIGGNKYHLDAALKIRLTHAGLAHLMAVSGYHIGLFSFPFLVLLRSRRRGFRIVGFIGLSATWWFIAFCGFPTSAIRAGLMISGYGLSQLLRLRLSTMQLMGIAAWSMILYNPLWAEDIGMQLSFTAVYAILMGIELLRIERAQHPIFLCFVVPITAQLGTGFISWTTFGLFPKLFLFFNVLASPIMILIGAATTGIMIAQFILDWEHVVHFFSAALNSVLHQILDWFENWHSSLWTWDLRVVDNHLLAALSLGYLLGGTLVVAQRCSLHQFLKAYCSLGLALVPWILWQFNTRVSVSYRYGLILEARETSSVSMVTHLQDSVHLVSDYAKYGTKEGYIARLTSDDVIRLSSETWAIAPSENAGVGVLKSRPFAWKRMNGSNFRFKFGEDDIQLKQWNRPTWLD